jgi:hypothetical protein
MSKGMNYLFGGGESKSQSTSNPIDMNPFKDLRAGFGQKLQELFMSGGGPEYKGPFAAGMTDAEGRALQGSEAIAFDPARRELLDTTLRGGFLPGQPGANPFLQASIEAAQRNLLEQGQRLTGRQLPSQAVLAGHRPSPGGSSAFDRARSVAEVGVMDRMKDISTQMQQQAYESERGRQTQAIALSQQEMETMTKNLQNQGLPRLIADLGIERGRAQFNLRSEALFKAIAMAGQFLMPNIANVQQSTSKSYQSKGVVPGVAEATKAFFPGGI